MKNRQAHKKNKKQWSGIEELREWFGITKAGGLMYISYSLAIAAMFFKSIITITILFSAALILSVISTVFGVKRNEKVSLITNIAKAISYPVCIGLLIWFILIKVMIMILIN